MTPISRLSGHRFPAIVWLLGIGFTTVSCSEPGPRATGTGSVRIEGEQARSWSGPCVYSRRTRWAASLPHEIRVGPDSGWALVISANRHYASGRHVLSRDPVDGPHGMIALVVEDVPVGDPESGADTRPFSRSVRGAVTGFLEIARKGDSLIVSLEGESGLPGTIRSTCNMTRVRD